MAIDWGTAFSSAAGEFAEEKKTNRRLNQQLQYNQAGRILDQAMTQGLLLETNIAQGSQYITDAINLGLTDRNAIKNYMKMSNSDREELKRIVKQQRMVNQVDAPDKTFDVYNMLGIERPTDAESFDIGQDWIDKTSKEFAGKVADPTITSSQEQLSFGQQLQQEISRRFGTAGTQEGALGIAARARGETPEALRQLLRPSTRDQMAYTPMSFKMPVDKMEEMRYRLHSP